MLSCFARVQSTPCNPTTPCNHLTHNPAVGSSTSLPPPFFWEVRHLLAELGSGPLPFCNLRWRWDKAGGVPNITKKLSNAGQTRRQNPSSTHVPFLKTKIIAVEDRWIPAVRSSRRITLSTQPLQEGLQRGDGTPNGTFSRRTSKLSAFGRTLLLQRFWAKSVFLGGSLKAFWEGHCSEPSAAPRVFWELCWWMGLNKTQRSNLHFPLEKQHLGKMSSQRGEHSTFYTGKEQGGHTRPQRPTHASLSQIPQSKHQ